MYNTPDNHKSVATVESTRFEQEGTPVPETVSFWIEDIHGLHVCRNTECGYLWKCGPFETWAEADEAMISLIIEHTGKSTSNHFTPGPDFEEHKNFMNNLVEPFEL